MRQQLKQGDYVEAWQEVEDPVDSPERRAFGVLLEVDKHDGLTAYKVGMGAGFFGWFVHCQKRNWSPEDMKTACLEFL